MQRLSGLDAAVGYELPDGLNTSCIITVHDCLCVCRLASYWFVGRPEGAAVEDLAEDEAGVQDVRVVASAVSAKRTVAVEVGDNGCVVGVRLLSDAVRRWDSYTLGERVVAVADVAHDRYLSNQPNVDGHYPDPKDVAAAELKLNF